MARFRLVVGPVPLHHQVYLDLSAALDEGEWKPVTVCPRARARAALRLQPDHRPPGPVGAGPRDADRADPRPRHVRPPSPPRAGPWRQPVVHQRDAEPRPRPRDAARRGPSEAAGEAVAHALELEIGAPTLYLERLRLADGEPLLSSRSISRPTGSGLLASDLEHNSLYQLLTERYGTRRPCPRGDRARPAPRPRGQSPRTSRRVVRRCSSRGSRFAADGVPVEFARATSVATARATTSSASLCAHRPPRWRSRWRVPGSPGWPARAGEAARPPLTGAA